MSACEKVSRIIPKKRNLHQSASAKESNGISSNNNNKTSQQTLNTDSTADMKQVFQLPITRLSQHIFSKENCILIHIFFKFTTGQSESSVF
jgi:hypothetical protein